MIEIKVVVIIIIIIMVTPEALKILILTYTILGKDCMS